MRIREILPESWWKDLDRGFLEMMGYSRKELEPESEQAVDLAGQVSNDVKAIRQSR